jgi:hypothetical protein
MTDREQNAPMQEGSLDGSLDAKKQGILVQVATDLPGRPQGDIIQMLTQRFSDAGIPVDAAEVRRLAESLPSVGSQGEAENEGPRAEGS